MDDMDMSGVEARDSAMIVDMQMTLSAGEKISPFLFSSWNVTTPG